MNDISVEDLAEIFKVCPAMIYKIRRGKAWRQLEVLGFVPCQRKLLSEKNVKAIKIALMKGERNYDIAKRFDVSPETVCNIKGGRQWKHIKVPGFKPSTIRGDK